MDVSIKKKFIDDLKKEELPFIIFCAGRVGKLLLEKCKDLEIPVTAFFDENDKLNGTKVDGVTVCNAEQIRQIYPDNPILIAYWKVDVAIIKLDSYGFYKSYPALILLDDDLTVQDSPDYVVDNTKFYAANGKMIHESYLLKDRILLQSLNFSITEKCNLRCKHCMAYTPYKNSYKDISVEKNVSDFKNIIKLCDYINILYFCGGGETFLSNKWQEFLVEIKKVLGQKVGFVIIITNGTIVPKHEDLNLLSHPRVFLFISDYGDVSCKKYELMKACRDYGIWYQLKQITWYKSELPRRHYRSDDENARIFHNCDSNNIFTIREGRIAKCGMTLGICNNLWTVPESPLDVFNYSKLLNDGISLVDVRKLFFEYINTIRPYKTCDYCHDYKKGGIIVTPGEQLPRGYRKNIYDYIDK